MVQHTNEFSNNFFDMFTIFVIVFYIIIAFLLAILFFGLNCYSFRDKKHRELWRKLPKKRLSPIFGHALIICRLKPTDRMAFFLIFTCIPILLAGLFFVFLLIFYEWRLPSYRRKVRKLPGPKMSRIFGIALDVMHLETEELMDFMSQIWKKVGDVIFFEILGIPSVCLMAPEDIELVFNNSQHISKGLEYMTITPWLCEGLLTSTGAKWHLRRKMLTPTFHFKILENYIPIFNRNAKLLTKKLSEQYKPVDIDAYVSLCTLDVICETAMGTSLDFQLGEAADYVSAIRKTGEIILKRNLTFWMYKSWLFNITPTGREFNRIVKRLHKFTENVIKERKQVFYQNQIPQDGEEKGNYKQRKSFLDCLLEMQRENPDQMTDGGIREEVDTFMFEGHDTTSVALSWALFMIATHPEVQEKIREEIFLIFGNSNREATLQDLHQMKYLEMVFKETLRLYPSVPYISRWLTEDLQIKQYTIPAETNISIIPYLIHRNTKIYPDPEKFNPDRFLPDVAKERHPYAFIPFSAGYRNCIGQKFALFEIKAILSTILRELQISTTMRKEDVKVLPQMILRPQPKLYISCSPIRK